MPSTAGLASGSSPLARGTRQDPLCGGALRGLIPARAGNTKATQEESANNEAHPRSRGEHLTRFRVGVNDQGSSPLARGTRNLVRGARLSLGLIPARAGNTRSVWVA